jgi:hypothetical protein
VQWIPGDYTSKLSSGLLSALNQVILRGANPAKALATAEGSVRTELKRLYG